MGLIESLSILANVPREIAQASNNTPIPFTESLPFHEYLNMDIFSHAGKGAVTGAAAYLAADALFRKHCPTARAGRFVPIISYGVAAVGAVLYEVFAGGLADLKDYVDDCIGAAAMVGTLKTKLC